MYDLVQCFLSKRSPSRPARYSSSDIGLRVKTQIQRVAAQGARTRFRLELGGPTDRGDIQPELRCSLENFKKRLAGRWINIVTNRAQFARPVSRVPRFDKSSLPGCLLSPMVEHPRAAPLSGSRDDGTLTG